MRFLAAVICLGFSSFAQADNIGTPYGSNGGGGSGGGGTVTSVTGTSPIASSGGATPNITFIPTLSSSLTVNNSILISSVGATAPAGVQDNLFLSSTSVANISGGGTIFPVYGLINDQSTNNNSATSSHMSAGEFLVNEQNVANRTTKYGVIGRVNAISTNAVSAINIYGVAGKLFGSYPGGTGTNNNFIGMYVGTCISGDINCTTAPVSTGTIIDFYIDASTGGVNHWALYQIDPGAKNYLVGNTGINTLTPLAPLDVEKSNASGYSIKASTSIQLGGCVQYGDGSQQCTTFPSTPFYQYTSIANTGLGFPIVNLSTGDLTVGGYTAAVTTMSAVGWTAWPAISNPSPLLKGQWWFNTNGYFNYSPDGSTVLQVSTNTGSVPGNPSTSLQYNNAGVFAGDANFTRVAGAGGISTWTVTEPIMVSSSTIIGANPGSCGGMFEVGLTGNRCPNAGANQSSVPVVIRNNGAVQLSLTDQSDSSENNIGVNTSGAFNGPNISNIANNMNYSNNIVGHRIGGTGVSTIGRLVSADAGTNAALYINYPSTASVGGTIYASMASTNTSANTNEIGFYEFAVPAFQFKNNGDCLEMVCGAAGAATATTKELRIRFNNTTLSSVNGSAIADTGAVTVNNADLDVRVKVCKNSSNSQVVLWSDNQAVATIGTLPPPPALSATDTAAINVSCTCQNGTGNNADCVGKGMTIEYKPAP